MLANGLSGRERKAAWQILPGINSSTVVTFKFLSGDSCLLIIEYSAIRSNMSVGTVIGSWGGRVVPALSWGSRAQAHPYTAFRAIDVWGCPNLCADGGSSGSPESGQSMRTLRPSPFPGSSRPEQRVCRHVPSRQRGEERGPRQAS